MRLPRENEVLDGRYQIEREIGRGGMGAVYLATHAVLGSKHAIKVQYIDGLLEPSLIRDLGERFLDEGRVLAQLSHPGIVKVSDVVSTDGLAALVMDYYDAQSLDVVLARQKRHGGGYSLSQIRKLALRVLDALAFVHSKGVIHRDLKPANVLLAPHPEGLRPVIIDFGIAKVQDRERFRLKQRDVTNALLGTEDYMSPEQAQCLAVDARADLFALGLILYELATLRHVRDERADGKAARTFDELVDALPHVPDDPSGAFTQVIKRALATHPNERYANAALFASALKALPLQPHAASTRGSPSNAQTGGTGVTRQGQSPTVFDPKPVTNTSSQTPKRAGGGPPNATPSTPATPPNPSPQRRPVQPTQTITVAKEKPAVGHDGAADNKLIAPTPAPARPPPPHPLSLAPSLTPTTPRVAAPKAPTVAMAPLPPPPTPPRPAPPAPASKPAPAPKPAPPVVVKAPPPPPPPTPPAPMPQQSPETRYEEETTALVRPRPGPRSPWIRRLVLLALALLGLVYGSRWGADRLADHVEQRLFEHKTVQVHNADSTYFNGLLLPAQVMSVIRPTPRLSGMYALLYVQELRWHWVRAKFDEAKFTEADRVTSDAIRVSPTAEALLARAMFTSRACLLLPSTDRRDAGLCDEAEERYVEAEARLNGDARTWLKVEAWWTQASFLNHLAAEEHDAKSTVNAQRLTQNALTLCAVAQGHWTAGVVNNIELAEECLLAAGNAGNYDAYLTWGALLMSYPFKNKKQRDGAVVTPYKFAHPDCAKMKFEVDAISGLRRPRFGQNDNLLQLCITAGFYALGCNEEASGRVLNNKSRIQRPPWTLLTAAVQRRGHSPTCPYK